MADITQLKRYGAPRINWGKWFLIGTGMLVSAFILLVPMIYIFVQAFSKGLMPVLQNLADPDMLHAIWLTVLIALIAVPVNLVFGVLLAWLVTRFNFPGRQLLLTLLDIPFAVSPVVAGLVYLLFYGSNGPLGGWLDEHNLQIMFDTDPAKKDKLMQIILGEIQQIADKGTTQENLSKVKEFMLKKHTENQKENGYWLGQIDEMLFTGSNMSNEYVNIVNAISNADIQKFASEIFSQNNRVEISMISPEKKK